MECTQLFQRSTSPVEGRNAQLSLRHHSLHRLNDLKGMRTGHFSLCDVFTLVDVENGEIKQVSKIKNEEHVRDGCVVPVQLPAKRNVNALVVVGLRPLMGFRQFNINVYHEAERAEIKSVVEDLIADSRDTPIGK